MTQTATTLEQLSIDPFVRDAFNRNSVACTDIAAREEEIRELQSGVWNPAPCFCDPGPDPLPEITGCHS